jgi:transcriptional regulator with XRE-family HTH domain
MVSREELGTRIDSALHEAGTTQTDLAQYLDCHPSSVSRMVSGDRRVDSVELTRIAEFVGRPVWWFLEERSGLEEVFARASAAADDAQLRRTISLFQDLLSEYKWLRTLEV